MFRSRVGKTTRRASDAAAPRSANDDLAAADGRRVNFKILAIAGTLIAVMVASAGIGIYQMRLIGDSIYRVAERELPLTGIITQVTEHQLEQAIALQRALRYGAEMWTDPAKRRLFDQTVARFEALAARTDAEFATAGAMVAKFIAAEEEGRELTEFQHIEAVLKSLDTAHATYQEHARVVLDALRRGNLSVAREIIEDVEAEEAKLDKELEELLDRIEAFTLESARTATIHPGGFAPDNIAA